MAEQLVLYGYHYSVYTRIVRTALIEVGLEAEYVEINPFDGAPDPAFLKLNPFGRVPVLKIGPRALTETAAILSYLNAMGRRQGLIPGDAFAEARMRQTIGIVDHHVYPVLIRQVFSNAVFAPYVGEPAKTRDLQVGLSAAPLILGALDEIAREGTVLNGTWTLADIHLSPMMDYFTMAAESTDLLTPHPHLSGWWDSAKPRHSLRATDPFVSMPQ